MTKPTTASDRVRAIGSLYHYYAHVEVLHYEYHRYALLPDMPPTRTPGVLWPAPPDPKEHGVVVLSDHWFAALYVLVEGWRELELHDPGIDSRLMEADHVDHLRRFRNVAYHFQWQGVQDPRSVVFSTDERLVMWAMDLSHAFRAFFAAANTASPQHSTIGRWLHQSP